MNELFGNFELTKRDKKLYELANQYDIECEAYDQSVCTGPIRHGIIMPATPKEMVLINRNAMEVRKRIIVEAECNGFSKNEILDSIKKVQK